MKPIQAAENALRCVLEAKEDESITIFCDDTLSKIGEAFEGGALNLKLKTKLVVLKTDPNVFRKQIPFEIIDYVTSQRSNIYINLLRGIREETPFRIELIHKETFDKKTRLGHCPGVTLEMLSSGALSLTVQEHREMQNFALTLMKTLDEAVRLEVTTVAGTRLSFSVKNRPFFTDTMLDWKLMKWMNLPTGEVIVAPLENSLEGILICDVAIGGIGLLKTPVKITVKEGQVDAVTSKDTDILVRVQETLHTDSMAKVVGEFAFGINPRAKQVEEFLEIEKILGTVHIAFGDNTDMPGGKNDSINHMDFVMNNPTVNAINENGSLIKILANGVFQEVQQEKGEFENSKVETLPISKVYRVVDYNTIFKTDLWWEAVVVFEMYGKRQIGLYLWQKRNGLWKRKNKFGVRNLDEWEKLKKAVDQLSSKLNDN